MKLKRHASCLFAAIAFATLAASAAPVVVPCDQPVKSRKRGVCINKADAKDFMALAPGVSWYYTWHFTDTNHAPKAARIEFLPMAWGNRPDDLKGLESYLKSNKPSHVFAINEPNLKGQAFIDPKTTAEFYQKVKKVADRHRIPVVGPHMALGSSAGDSITAMDPIENKQVTYTFMTPFLKAFLHYVGNTEVTSTAAHSYGNFGEFKWMVEMMYKEFKKPVWITEFASWQAPGEEAEIDYLIQCVDLMERLPYVEGYAWFKERAKDNSKISLLGEKPGTLTPLGDIYVNMPVHDPEVFYKLPGRLQLESYTAMDGAEIARTKDADGLLEMTVSRVSQWLDYQVSTASGGKFTAKLRMAAVAGTKVGLAAGDTELAEFTATTTGWQTLSVPVTLPAGNTSFRLRVDGAARLNWIEF